MAVVRLRTVLFGEFALDGGAMFGVVPRPLWERTNPPDHRNRIRLAMRGLAIWTDDALVLVDCGPGNKMSAKERDIYAIHEVEGGADAALGLAGATPEDVTHVVITHLHFDHAGGATRKGTDGQIRPTFPNATYLVQRSQLEWARNPTPRDRASFCPDDFEPLLQAGQLKTMDGPYELLPGVHVLVSDGHTPGMQMVKVVLDDATLVYPADLVPTSSHLPMPYVMGYDLEPLKSMAEKKALLDQAVLENHVLVYEHDPHHAATLVSKTDKGFRPKTWPELANILGGAQAMR